MRKFLAEVAAGSMPYVIALAVIAVLAYWFYEYLQKNYGAGTPDPGGGAPAKSLLGGLENQFLEVGGSSLSFEDAAATVAADPEGSARAIVGHTALWYASGGILGQ